VTLQIFWQIKEKDKRYKQRKKGSLQRKIEIGTSNALTGKGFRTRSRHSQIAEISAVFPRQVLGMFPVITGTRFNVYGGSI
jgi:hypothetical protein